jgi:hypothetical protein
MLKRLAVCCMMLGMISAVLGQEAWDVARTTINGKKVSIEYGRPVLGGRTLADMMKQLPADRIWRAGSGPVTILSTGADLLIGGKNVKAGNYALYMYCPEKGDYSLIINSDLGESSSGELPKATSNRSNRAYPHFMDYTMAVADKEVARVPLKQIKAPKTEVLIYSVEPAGKGATLTISWGDQSWTTDIQPVN